VAWDSRGQTCLSMIPGDGAVPPLPARRRRRRLVRCGGRTPARTGRRCVRRPTGPGRAHPGPAAPGFKSPQLQEHITAGHWPVLLLVALLVAVGLPDSGHSVLTAGSRSRPALRPGNDHGDHRGTGLTLHSRCTKPGRRRRKDRPGLTWALDRAEAGSSAPWPPRRSAGRDTGEPHPDRGTRACQCDDADANAAQARP
jgi:hypothetical protein